MIRSIVRAGMLGAAALTTVSVAQVASATAFTISFTGRNASANSANGEWIDYGTTAKNSAGVTEALNVDVYGGHLNSTGQSGNSTVSGTTVAAYSVAGLGVLFGSDSTSNGTHQIDNVGGGADFVALVFDQAVTLTGLTRTNYSGNYNNPITGYDTDASIAAFSGSIYDLANNGISLSSFTSVLDSATATNATKTSKIWLVSAYSGGQSNDAFKLRTITANTPNVAAVPEPASWAMMIVGFGAVGYGMRRRKVSGLATA